MAPIIAFDLYGTILSTDSIAVELAEIVGDDRVAKDLAALWRRYQLEYTWRINCMGHYRPFTTLTLASLQHAAADLDDGKGGGGLAALFTQDTEDRLMRAYNALHVFSDVPPAFRAIQQQAVQDENEAKDDGKVVEAYIFSNGTTSMITSSIANSPDLGGGSSGLGGVLRELISVDEVRVYKPDRRAYEHLLKRVGKEDEPEDVWLVSSNPFDVVGAVSAGLRAAWVDRAGKGWIDRLMFEPTLIVSGVDEAVREIMKTAE
ncbi:HAD-like domain-containing protein [Corynascus similis CBS 632.67]